MKGYKAIFCGLFLMLQLQAVQEVQINVSDNQQAIALLHHNTRYMCACIKFIPTRRGYGKLRFIYPCARQRQGCQLNLDILCPSMRNCAKIFICYSAIVAVYMLYVTFLWGFFNYPQRNTMQIYKA